MAFVAQNRRFYIFSLTQKFLEGAQKCTFLSTLLYGFVHQYNSFSLLLTNVFST